MSVSIAKTGLARYPDSCPPYLKAGSIPVSKGRVCPLVSSPGAFRGENLLGEGEDHRQLKPENHVIPFYVSLVFVPVSEPGLKAR